MDSTAPQGAGSNAALAEGRRIYLGNLLYATQPDEIEAFLQENGLGELDKIHMSIDPVSGRGPGYCFVEFRHREDADRVLDSLSGAVIAGRPVKVGPCHPKTSQRRGGGQPMRDPVPFQRWGDWKGERPAPEPEEQLDRGPYGAIQHLSEMATKEQDGRRLYVGGLGKMINQEQHQMEIMEYFSGFKTTAIGKRITPHPSTRTKPGNHHYCFIDFASPDDAKTAMKALDGRRIPGGTLKISVARNIPPKLAERISTPGGSSKNANTNIEDGLPQNDRPTSGRQGPAETQRSMMSTNWRIRS